MRATAARRVTTVSSTLMRTQTAAPRPETIRGRRHQRSGSLDLSVRQRHVLVLHRGTAARFHEMQRYGVSYIHAYIEGIYVARLQNPKVTN